ncbi:MAG: hypothetical protein HGA42_20570 [Nostocales cyanobacterium W4_Combined_metabat2_030]|nr:hypothetical protein [Nostocales cyanobacterium W4_Combined_metabat2_030]
MAIIDINIATPTLDEVTTSGNTTSNDINFDATKGILFNNDSRLREGTIDAQTGGSKGIAQICAGGYELKWEAGSQYVMDGNGVLVREVNHKFNIVPDEFQDSSLGFYVGSRWILDNGDVYVCTDSTVDNAVWEIVPNADWNATTGSTAIANKPTIPTIPTFTPMPFKQNVNVTHTGTTANTIVASYLITAGTFEANDFLRFVIQTSQTVNTNVKTLRVYTNTSVSLTGATLIATRLLTSASGTALGRDLVFKNSLTSQDISSTTNNHGDNENNTNVFQTSLTVDFTVNQYFILAVELTNTTDEVVLRSLRTNILR